MKGYFGIRRRNGQEIQMEILDYFEYDGELYAMLIEAEEYEHEHEHEHNKSMMKSRISIL